MKKSMKKTLLALCALGALTFGVACKSDNQEEKYSPFLMGIQTEFVLGETLILEDFIDYVDGEYTIFITRQDGFSKDVTSSYLFSPQQPGTYTMTYTIKSGKNKGVHSFDFTVEAPKMKWSYTMVNHIYDVGETMYFEEYFNEMNISAQSYYPWKMVMDSVLVDGKKTTFDEETEYTFQKDGIHTFKYHIESEDGQKYSLQQSVKVRYVDNEMLEWLSQNNMDVYNAVRLEKDQSIQLDEAIYVRDNTSVYPAAGEQMKDMPYVAYNGNYGLNDFVVVDFTGNNMPIILFFGDQLTNNVFYDFSGSKQTNKGLVFSNGWTFGTGEPCERWETSVNSRFCVHGPNKINKPGTDVEGWFRRQVSEAAAPMGMTNILKNGPEDRYRLAIGVTEGASDHFTVAIHFVNLTTGAVVHTGESVVEIKDGEGTMSADYYQGKIGLYGAFGKYTKLDRVYEIQTDTTFAEVKETMFQTATFLESAKTTLRPGVTQYVEDYIAPQTGAAYSLKYVDESGEIHVITGDTFTLDIGLYTLIYEDGRNLPGRLSLSVIDIPNHKAEELSSYKATAYKVTVDADGKYVLAASRHDGTDTQAPYHNYVHDMPYVAYNGNYGFNDFVVVDFTGNNMPYISFFNDEINNTIYRHANNSPSQNKGLVFASGFNYNTGDPITAWVNSVNNKLTLYGPNKTFNPGTDYEDKGWKRASVSNSEKLGMTTLSNNPTTRFRLAIGITAGDANSVTVAVHFVNLDTGAVLFSAEETIGGFKDKCAFPEGYFSGSIGLYGLHGKTTTIDRVHPIYENTTFEALKKSDLFGAPKFLTTAKTTVRPNTTLQVSDYIKTNMGGYTLSYQDSTGTTTAITGSTFTLPAVGKYTLVYSNGGLSNNLTITALNVSQTKADHMSSIQAIGYGVTTNTNDKLVLAGGSYTTDGGVTKYPTQQNTHDMAYIGFEGEYGLGDFVVMEFTGNNMPTVSFFNNELINTVFRHASNTSAQNKGLVINNGWLYNDGSPVDTNICKALTVYGPNKVFYPGKTYEDKGWFNIVAQGAESLGYITLRNTATTRYRLAIGVTEGSATSVTIGIYFVNLDTGSTLINDTFTIEGWAYDKCDFPNGYFSGSIGLYGMHGKTITLDKVYGIEQDTTLSAIAGKYAVNA